MSQWIVYPISATQVDDVNTQIQPYLDGLSANPGVANSVKITTSDMNHGDAWGVVVSCNDPTPPPMPLFTGWAVYEFEPAETDYQGMFTALQNAFNSGCLPDGTALSPNQLYFSQISMTNRQSGDATLTLFYPSM